MRIVVAMTGATGSVYAIELIKSLKEAGVKVHLIISEWAGKNLEIETDYNVERVRNMVDYVYEDDNLGASIASGSFRHQGMVIIPCSMKTLAGIAHGYAANLIVRAADVTLKESRKLIIVPRETPLNMIHLENMLTLAKMGVKVVPPMPSFYHRPQSIEDIVKHFIGRIMDMLEIAHSYDSRWKGV